MATKKKSSKKAGAEGSPRKKTSRKKKVEPASRGLEASAVADGAVPAEITVLEEQIVAHGGKVLASFRDPLGGHWQTLAALPIERVVPTPFQRDLSPAHAKRLAEVIDRLDWFIDPLVAVPAPNGGYWTPNGMHRLEAMKSLGAKSIVVMLLPTLDIAYQILALNTEKAHNVKEKSLEVVRMARFLAELEAAGEGPFSEESFALQFEEPAFVTLGCCYEQRGRFSGGAYNPVLKRVDSFLPGSITESLQVREQRATRLLELDDGVAECVQELKERGFDSPYLKAFVIARINPLRFKRGAVEPDFDGTLDKMFEKLESFDVGKVKADQVAAAAGPVE